MRCTFYRVVITGGKSKGLLLLTRDIAEELGLENLK
jgi:hypothetical protein